MSISALGSVAASGLASALSTKVNDTVIVAPHKATGNFSTPAYPSDNSAACDRIRDTLLAANWTLQVPLNAIGGLDCPYGWGYTGFQSHVASIGDGTHGTAYVFYNPATDVPPSGFIGSYGIQAVPIGGTSAASQANLIAAIDGTSGVTGLATSATHIQLTANSPGTLGNGIVIQGNGSISSGYNTAGGGWALQSRSQQDVFGKGNTARISFTVRTGAPASGNLQFNIVVQGYTVNFYLGLADWDMIADDFQAYFVGRTQLDGEDFYVFNRFCWAATLCIPDDLALSVAAFVSQPGNLPATSTLGASGGMVVDMFVDGTHTTGSIGQQGWSMAMFHSEAGAVADRLGNAILQSPYVSMSVPATGESRIVGTLFDCFLTSIPQPEWQQFTQQGDTYRVIATQSSPPGALLMMTGEVDNVGTPSSSNPVTKNPTYATGTGTVSFNGTNQGLLVYKGGTPFDTSWTGQSITIGGSVYTIVAVAASSSPQTLTFTPGGPYSISQNDPWSIAT